MPLTFPLSLSEFFEGLGIVTARFWLPAMVESGETGGGEIVTSSYGPRLWNIDVAVRTRAHGEQAKAVARMEMLLEAGGSFFAFDATRRWPQDDPSGAVISGASPVVDSVLSGNRRIKVTGLPAFYHLTEGDLIAWTYGGSPLRYALHRVAQGATASSTGIIAALELTSPVRPGTANGDPITLVDPACKAKVVPSSYDPPRHRAVLSDGFSFQARQTLR